MRKACMLSGLLLVLIYTCQAENSKMEKRSINPSDFSKITERAVGNLLKCNVLCHKTDCDCLVFQGKTCSLGHCPNYSIHPPGVLELEVHASTEILLAVCLNDEDCADPSQPVCRAGQCGEPRDGVLLIGGNTPALTTNVELIGDCDITISDLPVTQLNADAAYFDGLVYYCGGTDICQVLDADGVWKPGPKMTVSRSEFSLISDGQRLVAIGGKASSTTVDVLESSGGSWVRQGYLVTHQRVNHCAVAVRPNSVMLLGGEGTRTAVLLDVENGTEILYSSLKYLYFALGCALYNDKIVTTGGYTTSRGYDFEVYSLDLSVTSNPWITEQRMLMGRAYHTTEVVNGVITVFGGFTPVGAEANMEELKAGNWTKTPLGRGPRYRHGSTVFPC